MTASAEPAKPITAISNALDALRTACAFLTILPAAADTGEQQRGYLASAMGMFPIVGAGIGGVAAVVLSVAIYLDMNSFVSAALALATAVIITGALHEDGLADLADGFGGGRTPDDKLRIMHDSRIGTFGVLALVFGVLLRVGALAALAGSSMAVTALIAAGALSRTPMVVMAHRLPMATFTGLAAHAGRPAIRQVIIASVFAVLIAAIALGLAKGVAAVIAAAIGAGTVAWLALRQIGGCNGDVFGASQQVAEAAVMLAIVAVP